MPKTPRISIVDDDEVVREATADLVTALGFVASTFASVEQFLQSDKIRDTDCVITDLQMPGLTGLELQSCLHAQGNLTPVIFITAFPSDRAQERALNAGAIAFLSKPFEEGSLIKSLKIALGTRGAAH